jgi:hypothetical protein
VLVLFFLPWFVLFPFLRFFMSRNLNCILLYLNTRCLCVFVPYRRRGCCDWAGGRDLGEVPEVAGHAAHGALVRDPARLRLVRGRRRCTYCPTHHTLPTLPTVPTCFLVTYSCLYHLYTHSMYLLVYVSFFSFLASFCSNSLRRCCCFCCIAHRYLECCSMRFIWRIKWVPIQGLRRWL